MVDANIHTGDLLIIDRSKDPMNGSIIVAVLNSEFTVREYSKRGEQVILIARNKNFKPISISHDADFMVWGVVTFIIHNASIS
jgi:DNA polymerase V